MKRLLYASILLISAGCSDDTPAESPSSDEPKIDQTTPDQKIGTSYKINYIDSVGWGYQIFDGTQLIINQEHIPAVQGMKGFETKEHAEIAAKFILEKIDKGIFPPTISPDELDSLGVYSTEK